MQERSVRPPVRTLGPDRPAAHRLRHGIELRPGARIETGDELQILVPRRLRRVQALERLLVLHVQERSVRPPIGTLRPHRPGTHRLRHRLELVAHLGVELGEGLRTLQDGGVLGVPPRVDGQASGDT